MGFVLWQRLPVSGSPSIIPCCFENIWNYTRTKLGGAEAVYRKSFGPNETNDCRMGGPWENRSLVSRLEVELISDFAGLAGLGHRDSRKNPSDLAAAKSLGVCGME